MEMLIEVVAAVLLLAGSGLIFYSLLALDAPQEPAPVVRPQARQIPAPPARKLPRAA